MTNPARIAQICLLVGAISISVLLLSYGTRLLPESTPVARGAINANVRGCMDCHGQPGRVWPDDATIDCTTTRNGDQHPDYVGRCTDLLAYFEVVRLKKSFPHRASAATQNHLLQGEKLAREYNCFQCHGELGQGGFLNAGALKGYIPGYFGKDFALLTADGTRRSVQTWISTGTNTDLFANPLEGLVAKFFLERQAVSMPIFESLPESSVQILTDYVIALHRLGKMDAKAIRAYSHQTTSTSG